MPLSILQLIPTLVLTGTVWNVKQLPFLESYLCFHRYPIVMYNAIVHSYSLIEHFGGGNPSPSRVISFSDPTLNLRARQVYNDFQITVQ
jgi:hypothetical protein